MPIDVEQSSKMNLDLIRSTCEDSSQAIIQDLDTFKNSIINGDCLKVLPSLPENCIDLIVTSPPYADGRAKTYGEGKSNGYVEWFLPINSCIVHNTGDVR